MKQPGIIKEVQLLVALCRLRFSDKQLSDIKIMVGEVGDWDYFSKLANDHGISALVYDNLERAGVIRLLPESSRAFLRNAFLLSMTRNASLMNMLGKVVRNIKAKTVLLKGAALELMVYGNRGLRQMSDVDILLTREDCFRSYRYIIENMGFNPYPLKSRLHKPIIGYYGKHLPSLIRNGVSIELHHKLFDDESNEMTRQFYETSFATDLSGVEIYIPEPSVFFLYLVKHLYSHELSNDSQLRLHTDLAVLVENYADEILKPGLLENSSLAEMNTVLASKLHILEVFWDVDFPGFIKDFIRNNKDDTFVEKFVFFLSSPKNNPPGEKKTSYRQALRSVPGLHRKILFVTGDLFPTIAFMKERYGCRSALKALLYYPHRWGKVLWLLTPAHRT